MLGHIGDSRCYRLRDGELVQITKDHSLLQEQMDAGLITPEQAATSTNKNLVTRALGVEDAERAAILQAESLAQADILGQPNQREAVAAEMAKRPPRFMD